jgi:hypothetical protein
MKISFVLTALLIASTAGAQTSSLADSLERMERDSWRAWQSHDGKFFDGFLSDDHVELGEFGSSSKAEVVAFVASGTCKVSDYSVDHFKTTQLAPDAVLLTYHAAQNTVCGGGKAPSPVWVSSLFINHGGRWLNAAYQQTPDLSKPAKQ